MHAQYKILSIILLSILISTTLWSQNLVINGSLEDRTQCPDNQNRLIYCENWFNPIPTSADYFHACNNTMSGNYGVPQNSSGWQPAKYGEAYVGIFLAHPFTDYREYVSAKLREPLEVGKSYCFSMYLSVAEKSKFAIDRVGVLFTTDSIQHHSTNNNLSDQSPQIESVTGQFWDDTTSWMKFEHTFIADSAYHYITIGNFQLNAHTNRKYLKDSTNLSEGRNGYYYVDDISLVLATQNVSTKINGPNVICQGDSATLSIQTAPGQKILWSTGAKTASIKIFEPGIYTVTSSFPCQYGTDTIQISQLTLPQNLVSPVYIKCLDNFVEINLEGVQGEILWSNGDRSTNFIEDQPGNYSVSLSNYCGQVNDEFKIIETACTIFVPNTITPNNDGQNDVFFPVLNSEYITFFSCNIYNRWGQIVFSSNNSKMSWDGSYKGKVTQDMYNYHILYSYQNEPKKEIKGMVLVIP